MLKKYDLSDKNHQKNHINILKEMLSDKKYKIINYLKDNVLLKENALLLMHKQQY
jgi:hypothetical protein